MKVAHWVFILLAVIACGGCKKTEKPSGADVQTIDATQLRPAFANAPAATQALIDDVMMSIQSSSLNKALADLETLSNQADLTPLQKKTLTNLTSQVRRKLADIAATPTQ